MPAPFHLYALPFGIANQPTNPKEKAWGIILLANKQKSSWKKKTKYLFSDVQDCCLPAKIPEMEHDVGDHRNYFSD